MQQELEKRVQKDDLQQVLDKNAADKIIQINKRIQKKQKIATKQTARNAHRKRTQCPDG